MIQTKLCIVLVILLAMLFERGCSIEPSDYTIADYNVVWTKCKNEIGTQYMPLRVYYQIDGISKKQYIACEYYGTGKGADAYPVLMRHKDFDHSLEFDISSAKLILCRNEIDIPMEEWRTLGKAIMVQELLQIDQSHAEQLADAIMAEDYEDISAHCRGSSLLYDGESELDGERKLLKLQFALKDYDTISWVARINKCDEAYYIEIKQSLLDTQHIRCSDEFASIINKAVDEYGLRWR